MNYQEISGLGIRLCAEAIAGPVDLKTGRPCFGIRVSNDATGYSMSLSEEQFAFLGDVRNHALALVRGCREEWERREAFAARLRKNEEEAGP